MKKFPAMIGDKPMEFALLAAVVVGGLWVVNRIITADLRKAAGAIGDGISGVAESAGGIITGHNTITVDTPYDGAGILGSLGAATDRAAGGFFSTLGEWIGGTIADATQNDGRSSSFQAASNKPYNAGWDASYADAIDSSPVPAGAVATPWTISPLP